MAMSSKEWANRLDTELGRKFNGHAGDQVSFAYADGTAAGVPIDIEADDDYGRQLTATDGTVVRFNEPNGWWA